MPSMGKIDFFHKNGAGEVMEFAASCSVDSSGTFAIVLPDELAEVAAGMGFSVTRPRTNHRLEHRDLETAKRQVKQAMAEYMAAEVITERFVAYETDMKVLFWQNPDGTVAANGSVGVSREQGGEWGTIGDLHARNVVSHYRVGLFARVVDRVEYRRPNATKVVFKLVDAGHFKWHDGMEWAYKLNAFTGLAGLLSDERMEAMPRLPYTEDTAKFFHDTLVGLCVLARNIDGFFKSPERLMLAIENQAPMLAAPQVADGQA